MHTLDELFEQVTVELRAGNKLKTLKPLIDSYSGSDWKNFKFFSPAHYTKNTVLLNDVLEIAILCWEVNQGCPIHDHPDKGCLVRIMQGKLKETRYELLAYPVFSGSTIFSTIQDSVQFHSISTRSQTISPTTINCPPVPSINTPFSTAFCGNSSKKSFHAGLPGVI